MRNRYFVEGNRQLLTAGVILDDCGIDINGVMFWGMPYHPLFRGWPESTFMRTAEELEHHCSFIPRGIDVLLTHGPPFGILDFTCRGENAGCHSLRSAVERVRPKVHFFGHIHIGGEATIGETTFINCALHDDYCSIVRRPVVFDL